MRVNAVSPGGSDKPMAEDDRAKTGRLLKAANLPVGRVDEAKDIAQNLSVLPKEFSTAQSLVVDGGTVLV